MFIICGFTNRATGVNIALMPAREVSAMARRSNINNITEGIIWRQLLAFFFPILLGSFFQQLYNTVDAVVVGRFVGKQALAAVGGSTGTLINLLIGLFNGIASGATVVISQFYGAARYKDATKAIRTSVALALAGGAVLTVVGLALSGVALRAIATPADAFDMALTYIRIYFSGITFSLIYNMGAGIIRAMGDSRRPLYFLIVSCLINIVADLLLVVELNMGVAGAAIATVLSQAVSALLVLRYLSKGSGEFSVRFKKLGFEKGITGSIIRIGVPIALQSTLYSVSNIIIQSAINSFGTDASAAWTAYGKIDSLFWMMISAFGIAITTFSGQNFGAMRYDRVRQSVRACLGMSLLVTLAVTGVTLLGGRWILGLFTDDTAVLEIGFSMVRNLSPFYFTSICVELLSGAVRGAGDSLVPTLSTVLAICGLRAFWVVAVVPLQRTLEMVELSYPITWSAASLLFILYYLFGGWMKRCIKRAGHPRQS